MTGTETTTVVYNVTMDDLLAFGVNHNRNSTTLRRARRRITIGAPIGVFLIALGFNMQIFDGFLPAMFAALALSVLVAVYYVYYFKYRDIARIKKTLKQLYAEDMNPGLTGKQTLEVDENGFGIANDYSQTQCSWGKLVRIETEPGYTYLYTGSANGIVIPHASIITGDLRAVMAQIEQHYHPEKLLAQ